MIRLASLTALAALTAIPRWRRPELSAATAR